VKRAVLFVVATLAVGVAMSFESVTDFLYLGHEAGINISGSIVGSAIITGGFFYFQKRIDDDLKRAELARQNWDHAKALEQAELDRHRDFVMQLSLEADLRGINLDGRELPGIFLRHKNLSDSSVQKADLSRCDLSFSDFARCDLRDSRLTGARANHRTVLADAILDGANLDGAQFHGVHAPNARFAGASAEWAIFRGGDFTDAVFAGANLRGADFTGARLCRADFRDAVLHGAKFVDTDRTGATGLTGG
jgi:uncharacterized protein YjbI with pentapeptide repeats